MAQKKPAGSSPTPPPTQAADPGEERAATDAGRLGDKIGHFDPAAAPVQTDAEASGRPTPRPPVESMITERLKTAGHGASGEPGFGREQQPRASVSRHLGSGGQGFARTTRITIVSVIALVLIGLLAGILLA